jgi:hypothetical protein
MLTFTVPMNLAGMGSAGVGDQVSQQIAASHASHDDDGRVGNQNPIAHAGLLTQMANI